METENSVNIIAAQIPISNTIDQNFLHIQTVLMNSSEDDIILFPEGSISGYSETDNEYFKTINYVEVESTINKIKNIVDTKKVHIIIGSLTKKDNTLLNSAIIISYSNPIQRYNKINLSMLERSLITPGNELPIFDLNYKKTKIKIGIQICREIRYPEQWKYLAQCGASILFYLTYTTGNQFSVWRSHLISRAAENQRYVIASNVAKDQQQCPTMIVSPIGEVLSEIIGISGKTIHKTINLKDCSDWYISQNRNDVVKIETGT